MLMKYAFILQWELHRLCPGRINTKNDVSIKNLIFFAVTTSFVQCNFLAAVVLVLYVLKNFVNGNV